MIRKPKQSIGEVILKEVRKVLQESALAAYIRHPCGISVDGVDDVVYDYGEVRHCIDELPPDVMRLSGEAVDDYNMTIISPMSRDRYAGNVYSALIGYLDGGLLVHMKRTRSRIEMHRRMLAKAEAEAREIDLSVQCAWVMAKEAADNVREAVEQYNDSSATDMVHWSEEIERTLSDGGRNKDGTRKRVIVDGKPMYVSVIGK